MDQPVHDANGAVNSDSKDDTMKNEKFEELSSPLIESTWQAGEDEIGEHTAWMFRIQ